MHENSAGTRRLLSCQCEVRKKPVGCLSQKDNTTGVLGTSRSEECSKVFVEAGTNDRMLLGCRTVTQFLSGEVAARFRIQSRSLMSGAVR